MSVREYAYAYLTSKKDITAIMKRETGGSALWITVLAVAAAAFPETFTITNYAYNFALIGGSVAAINWLLAVAVNRVNGRSVRRTFAGLLHFTGAALIINMVMLAALYAVGLPFGMSDLLLSVAATLISTYYFIVLLAVAAGSLIEKESKRLGRYGVELLALALWYAFVFYILRMTA